MDHIYEIEAESHFQESFYPGMVVEVKRAIIPELVTRSLEDPVLKAVIRDAWIRESKYPLTLSIALRPALRHMGFHIFKAGKGISFVTTVVPKPIAPEKTIEPIKKVLEHIRKYPGCSRQKLLEGLVPGKEAEPEEITELISHLRWLIEKGHVIEFFNGTLSVPKASR